MDTYINDLFNEFRDTAVGKNLTLRGFMVEEDVKGSILVLTCSLVESTDDNYKSQYLLEEMEYSRQNFTGLSNEGEIQELALT